MDINTNREILFARKDRDMPTLADIPEIVSGKNAAKVLGKSHMWLWRRKRLPIYAPNADGEYTRRQLELIVEVAKGTYTAEYAGTVFQAERDAERMHGAIAIANAKKRRMRK